MRFAGNYIEKMIVEGIGMNALILVDFGWIL